jgi:hypothetical protein
MDNVSVIRTSVDEYLHFRVKWFTGALCVLKKALAYPNRESLCLAQSRGE